MSELGIMPPVVAEQQEAQAHWGRYVLAAGLAASLAVAGCGGGNKVKVVYVDKASATTEATDSSLKEAGNACGVEANLEANLADSVFGSPESFLPSLKTVSKGHENLLPTEKAKELVKKQLADDERVLGIFTAFILDTRKNEQLPDAGTLGRAHKLIETYKTNKEVATQDLAEACAAVDFLVPTHSFAVTKGQAMEVQALHRGSHISKIRAERVHSGGNLAGFEVGFNHDDPKLNATQKAIFSKLQGLMLFTDKGTLVINEVFGPSEFSISHNQHQAHVRPTKHGKIRIPASALHKFINKGGSKNTNGTDQGQSTEGQTGGGGNGHAKGKAKGPNTGGGNKNSTGNCGGCGQGQGGGGSTGNTCSSCGGGQPTATPPPTATSTPTNSQTPAPSSTPTPAVTPESTPEAPKNPNGSCTPGVDDGC